MLLPLLHQLELGLVRRDVRALGVERRQALLVRDEPGLRDLLLVTATETNAEDDMDALCGALQEVLR